MPKFDGTWYGYRPRHSAGYQHYLEFLLRERGCQLQRALQVTNAEQVLDMDQYTTGLAD